MSSGDGDGLRRAVLGGEPAEGIAALLDAQSLAGKTRMVRALHGRRSQERLWELVADAPVITVDDLLPASYEPMRPVRFHGKNSLPAFSEFRKVCCRPPGGENELWGYNDTSLAALIGPGYFVVHEPRAAPMGGAAFDYTRLPEAEASGWPQIRSNDRGLSRLVYSGMIDYMRRVADGVFIGCATRAGRELGSYFVIVRELG